MSNQNTDAINLFRNGFECAVVCWQAGCTTEEIAHTASPEDRGAVAACELILGWHDLAEQEAHAIGMTRDEAARYVQEQVQKIRKWKI